MSFNPIRVPSVRVNGEREPLCERCVYLASSIREANGLEPIHVHGDAYEPCDEIELYPFDDMELEI